MLTKPPTPEFDANDPWQDDQLGRQRTGQKIQNILETAKDSYVVGIHAPYGSGKSFFVHRLRQSLENAGYNAFYFNAWETDVSEQPLLTFVGNFAQQLEDLGIQNDSQAFSSLLKSVGGYLGKRALPYAVRVVTSGLFDPKDLKSETGLSEDQLNEVRRYFENIADDAIAAYQKTVKEKNTAKSHLQDLAEKIREQRDRAGPIYIFVDELDRCRPSYTIEFLESVKHVFDVDQYVFVLSIDRTQLESAVKAAFGPDIDVDGYLRRFVDWSFHLPKPKLENYVKYIFERLSMREAFGNNRFSKMDTEEMPECFAALCNKFGPTLREIEQTMIQANLCLRSLDERQRRYGPLVGVILGLKLGRPDLYNMFLMYKQSSEEVIEALGGTEFIQECPWLSAWLLVADAKDRTHLTARIETLTQRLNKYDEGDLLERKDIENWLKRYDEARHIFDEVRGVGQRTTILRYISDVLEFTEETVR